MSKFSNAIIIGGTIAAGKSSVVGALPFKSVQELDQNDELQKVLLKKMYEGDPIAKQVFQLDMMLTRFDKYKKLANSSELHVFDRSIFEDRLFAKLLFGEVTNIYKYYESIWEDKVEELLNEVGMPKLYILVDVNWETFTDRLFSRNRKVEIDNFEENKAHFKKLADQYIPYMKETLEKYDIPYVVIDANDIDKLQVIEKVKEIINERGIA